MKSLLTAEVLSGPLEWLQLYKTQAMHILLFLLIVKRLLGAFQSNLNIDVKSQV